jgi:allophanate hydrolase
MVLDAIYRRIAARGDDHVWISLIPRHEAMARATQLAARHTASEVLPPLWGLPFAIKDNIDVAEVPTTAACPAYAYIPDDSATVVDRLIAAGAIPIGKTNLDQFATGLVGVRSPYGVPANPFHPAYIPGGSSSGSAVTVATGLVSFALGTDTAGSGRIPAAFCNVVGLKPTRGLIPTVGLVPACRSLDCVSIFALTVEDAATVLSVAAGSDPQDA